jgi:hypothetical protein
MGDSGNTMTNAQVLQYTAGSTGHTLKMKITEGMPDILVPDGIPIVRMILMKQSDLKVDRTVHVRSQNQSGDVVTADFVDIVK